MHTLLINLMTIYMPNGFSFKIPIISSSDKTKEEKEGGMEGGRRAAIPEINDGFLK